MKSFYIQDVKYEMTNGVLRFDVSW